MSQTATTYDIPLMSGRRLKSNLGRSTALIESDGRRGSPYGRGLAETQVGGLSSPASQPSALDLMGSLGMMVVLMCPHFWHSKLRTDEPSGPDPRYDNSMRCREQFGQPGRSIAEICAADTGLNSGMMHRA